jgi:peptide/nickel transport system ATP-binding protein
MNEFHPILFVKDVTITFGGAQPFTAVDRISVSVGCGKTLAVVGESGSGKSLTALSLMGLLPPAASVTGQMFLNAHDHSYAMHTFKNTDEWRQVRGNKIGMIFQEPMSALNPVLKVGSQLAEAILTGHSITLHEANQLAVDWLGRVQLPDPEAIYHRYPHQLSGGQKQRVMIAMAMCNDPVLLIADEPTTALDVTVQAEIVQLMKQLQQAHDTAMIFITHDLGLASTIADEVLVMYKGEVVEYGNTEQVLHNPQHPYTAALLACRPTAQQKNKKLPVVEDFLNAGTLPLKQEVRPPKIEIAPAELLKITDLKVWFAGKKELGRAVQYFKAVDGVSFTLYKGEVLGLVGESGCGKSTLSRALMGLIPIHSGSILYDGKELANAASKVWNEARRDIQMIFQDPYASLNPRLTIGDAIMEPMRVHGIVPVKELQREMLRMLNLVHLPADAAHRYPHQFSGGQRQRIGIARALALRPKVLICDESVSALDVSVQAQILNLLKELQYEFQLTYVFISHDLGVVYYISDRVMVMQAGKIVEAGDAEQVLKHPVSSYTERLVRAMPRLV